MKISIREIKVYENQLKEKKGDKNQLNENQLKVYENQLKVYENQLNDISLRSVNDKLKQEAIHFSIAIMHRAPA